MKAFYINIFPQPLTTESLVLLVAYFKLTFCLNDLSELSDSENLFDCIFSYVAGLSVLQTISACRVRCIFFQSTFEINFSGKHSCMPVFLLKNTNHRGSFPRNCPKLFRRTSPGNCE